MANMTPEKKSRILFFDVLRIVAIFLVVLAHVFIYRGNTQGQVVTIPGIYSFTYGGLGVSIFILVSGSVLAYTVRPIGSLAQFKDFFVKRLVRIYPAYWYSLILAIFLNVVFYFAYHDFRLSGLTAWDYVLSFSGFQAFFGQWGGRINEVGWFIGLIVCLYLLYPLIACAFEKSRIGTLVALLLINLASNALVLHFDPADTYQATRWFPLCNVFVFGLGIFLVKTGLYPKNVNGSRAIVLLSDLSFYVFLVHLPLLYLIRYSVVFFAIATLATAYLFYRFDNASKAHLVKLFKNKGSGERLNAPFSRQRS